MMKEKRMQPTSIGLAFATVLFVSTPALASDFDGSKPLICAPVEAMDCTPGAECFKGTPDDIGAPAFMRLDFAEKTIIGPKRASRIQSMENVEDQLLLRGIEL